jgi:glucose/arabinose dehydrogenase
VLPLLTLPDVTPTGESGLLGMTLHPQFAANPFVYVVYNYTASAGGLREKLVRYTYAPAAGTLTSPLVLLDNITAATTHSGSRLLILPDLTLLMTTGDAQLRPESQNRASLNGKVLRLNLDGTVPANNPTPGSYVYTLGHRNPQGLTMGPGGRIYSSEHGDSTEDEINLIEPNRNYGWPNVEGYCNTTAELTFCAANNVREPLTTWTPTIAPAGLAYYDHPAIPGWRGSLLLAVLKNSKMVQLPLTATGTAIGTQADFITTYGRLRSICVSPQGKVYVGTSNRDGRGAPRPTDDRILVLENRSFVSSTGNAAARPSLRLWPNPARQEATLQLPNAGMPVRVRDLLGRTLQTLYPGTTLVTINVRGLRPGTYLVEAETNEGTQTHKLVVE